MLLTFVIKADAEALRDGRCVGWATEVGTGHKAPFTTSADLIRLLGDAANSADSGKEET